MADSSPQRALAIFAHPDDIEFSSAGTLLQLKQLGWDIHYMNVSAGGMGSASMDIEETREIRSTEAQQAAEILGATWHPPISEDLEIIYSIEILRKLAALIRTVRPTIVLTHSPQDYMEDHECTCRLTVTATFSHGMRNFVTAPPTKPWLGDIAVYHAMPHGLCDPLRNAVEPDGYVDTSMVHSIKRKALAAHQSQKEWLDKSQGMDSYLQTMDQMSEALGIMSGSFEHAEGWRRRLHFGFSITDFDPLADALDDAWQDNEDGPL